MKKFIILILVFISAITYSQTTPGEYTIKNVITNTKYSDFGTTFFGKDKVIFASPKDNTVLTKKTWSGNNQPFLDLYIGTINEKGEIIGKKRVLGDVNNKFHEGIVSFTKDLKTVYFSANNYTENNKAKKDSTGMVNIQLYKASVSENGEWNNVVKLPFNNDEYSTGHPALNIDDTKLYFISDRPESIGKTDIYVVNVNEDNTYSEPENLGSRINTEEREMFPFISDDNVLYFSSNGLPGYGGLDVFASRIFDTTVSEPINLEDPVNSSNDDFAFIINDDKHKGYFSSNNRKDGKGDDDIYSFIAFPPLQIEGNQAISGIILDKITGEILPEAIVILQDEDGNEIDRVNMSIINDPNFTGGIGDLNKNNEENITVVNGEVTDIRINKTVDNLTPNAGEEVEFTIEVINKGTGEATEIKVSDILPEGYTYVSDDGTGTYVSSTDVFTLPNLAKGETQTVKIKAILFPSRNDGSFVFEAKSDTKYKIVVIAPGYLNEAVEIKTVNDTDVDPLKINVGLAQELKVVDEKIMININTIYFDFDKWNIRPDAAKELDKVIAVLKEHPSMIIEGGSHTDSRARESYNQILSQKRAKATIDYITARGIDPSRLTAKGYGEMQLVNNCSSFVTCSREEHQLNRRTEFVIVNDNNRFASANASIDNVVTDKKSFKIIGNEKENITAVNVEEPKNKVKTDSSFSKTTSRFIKIAPIYFDFDKWSLSDKELHQLDKVVQVMNENPAIIIEVGAHTDSKNLESYNQLLSDKRAKTVVQYIISKGISPNRITGKGYGEMILVNHCKSFVPCSAEEKQANRRTEFMIISGNNYPSEDFIEKKNEKYINTNPIYFNNDKFNIRKDAAYELDRVIRMLKENLTMVIEAESHTDSKNTEAYNQVLSEKRAKAVVEYITSKGINLNRIIGKGYGEMQLINHCKSFVKCTPKEQQANRRTEFKIVKM